MEFVTNLLVVLHIVGLAALLGGFLVQFRRAPYSVNQAMLWGARAQIVTGILLVGSLEMDDVDVNQAKVGLKLLIALVIVGITDSQKKIPTLAPALWATVGSLTVTNIAIAVFW